MTKKIWIISDTHFNHQSIINDFEFRPYNYWKQIINKIKNNVKKWDILIHLWDVIFDRQSELKQILDSMWSWIIKILVRWNHDKNNIGFYLNKWFDFVLDEFKIKNYMWYNIVFSHTPKTDIELEDWYINIHWHLHTNSHHILKYTIYPEKYICYSAEKENYMPILLSNMIKRINN